MCSYLSLVFMMYLLTTVICLFTSVIAQLPANHSSTLSSYNAEEKVIEMIMARLNHVTRNSRPISGPNKTVDVRMSISLNHILDFDERNQVLTTMIWKSLSWQDKRLSWDADMYDGLQKVTLPANMIWTPDIMLYNSMNMKIDEVDTYRLMISSTGDCEWIPAVVYKSVCLVDMENFPYDTQTCYLKFGSWSHSEDQVNLTLLPSTNGMDLSTYTNSMEWKLSKAVAIRNSQKYECCVETFVDVTYTFVLVRNSAFYTQFLIMPIVLLSGMVITIFWIPPTRPDRTGLGMSLFASFMLLLLLVVQISPPSKSIKLVTYCCFNIILIATATLLSTIVVNCSQNKKALPYCLKQFCSVISSITRQKLGQRKSVQDPCLSIDDDGKGKPSTTKHSSNRNNSNTEQWQFLALILDRTFFVIFSVISLVFIVLYLPRPM